MFGNKVGHLGRVGSLTLAQRVSAMFSRGEPGAWYDPSDISTLFQDAAGTTPVTAVEQPVGRILDKSGRGNHATQATTTKRPLLSRRVNLLQKTEDFTATYWTKDSVVVSNSHPSPGGGVSAMSMRQNSSTGSHSVRAIAGFPVGNYEYSVFVKKDGARFYQVANQSDAVVVNFDLDTSTYQVVGGTVVSANIELIGEGWYLLKVNFVTTYGGIYNSIVTSLAAPRVESFAGDGVSGFLVYAPNICLRVDAHLPYQRINTATDYDADPSKFPAYLRFDGVDDALQTGNIDFTSTDKMTVWAGVNESSTAQALIVELTTFGLNTGAFTLYALSGAKFAFTSIGPSPNNAITAVVPESTNHVVTGYSDVAGGICGVRLNGAPTAVALTGSGSHANAPLYIGSRSSTSNYLNGRLYSLIVRGAQSNLSQIEAAERYIKQKMRMP